MSNINFLNEKLREIQNTDVDMEIWYTIVIANLPNNSIQMELRKYLGAIRINVQGKIFGTFEGNKKKAIFLLEEYIKSLSFEKNESIDLGTNTTDKPLLLIKIDNLDISEVFEILKQHKITDQATFTALEKEYILGKHSIDYIDRLKTFVNSQIR